MSLFDNDKTSSSIADSITAEVNGKSADNAIITAIRKEGIHDIVVDYCFDIINEHSVQINNNITDNYVENNTTIQDHIAQSPVIVTLRGVSGEKVFSYNQGQIQELLQKARVEATKLGKNYINKFQEFKGVQFYNDNLDKLTAIKSLYPPSDNATQLFKNAYDYAQASYNRYKGVVDKFRGKESPLDAANGDENPVQRASRLQAIYEKFIELRDNNIGLTVTTPYKQFTDMYIQSLTLTQGNELYVTEIELTLKQIRTAETLLTVADPNVRAMYNSYPRADVENNGKTQGTNDSITWKRYHNKPIWE